MSWQMDFNDPGPHEITAEEAFKSLQILVGKAAIAVAKDIREKLAPVMMEYKKTQQAPSRHGPRPKSAFAHRGRKTR
jgi:hypothetical protein